MASDDEQTAMASAVESSGECEGEERVSHNGPAALHRTRAPAAPAVALMATEDQKDKFGKAYGVFAKFVGASGNLTKDVRGAHGSRSTACCFLHANFDVLTRSHLVSFLRLGSSPVCSLAGAQQLGRIARTLFDIFDDIDTDHSGSISKAKWIEYWATFIDYDKNGTLQNRSFSRGRALTFISALLRRVRLDQLAGHVVPVGDGAQRSRARPARAE